jgi:hypothetical protein
MSNAHTLCASCMPYSYYIHCRHTNAMDITHTYAGMHTIPRYAAACSGMFSACRTHGNTFSPCMQTLMLHSHKPYYTHTVYSCYFHAANVRVYSVHAGCVHMQATCVCSVHACIIHACNIIVQLLAFGIPVSACKCTLRCMCMHVCGVHSCCTYA